MPRWKDGGELSRRKDIGSLAGIPIVPRRGGQDLGGKQGDLTPLLQLAHDDPEIAALAPEVASPTAGLLGYADQPHAAIADSFFAKCSKRIRRFVARRDRAQREPDSGQ
jgi:hypothetical protein